MIRLTFNEHSPELFAELKALAKPAAPPAPIALPEPHHRPSYPARWQPLDRLMRSEGLRDFLGIASLAVYRDPAERMTVFHARRKKCGHKIGFRAPDEMIEDVQLSFCGWLTGMLDSIPCECSPVTNGTFSTEDAAARIPCQRRDDEHGWRMLL